MMNSKAGTKIFALLALSALMIQCSKSGSVSALSAVDPGQVSANACLNSTVPCAVNHGTGIQSCDNSNAGPTYGSCNYVICDSGFIFNSSNGLCVATEAIKLFSMRVTGPDLDPAGVTSFIAQPGQTYDFHIYGSEDVTAQGINNDKSYAQYLTGTCKGIALATTFPLNRFTTSGLDIQFGDNYIAYTGDLIPLMSGCNWQLCAIANDVTVGSACVDMISIATALPPTTTTTTTQPATTTTAAPVTTTTLPVTTTTTLLVTTTTTLPVTTTTTLPPTTTTTTLAPTTTTTTLPPTTTTTLHPTTTTTTLPPPPPTTTTTSSTTTTHAPTTTTTTLAPTTTTTTLPPTTTTTMSHPMPVISNSRDCVGPVGSPTLCHSPIGSSTGQTNVKSDPGCSSFATVTYKGQTVNLSLFGNAAPYYGNGQGNHTTTKTVNIAGVDFMIAVNDNYSKGSSNWVTCVGLISWPNFPSAP